MDREIHKIIEDLTRKYLKEYPPFHSRHEIYGLLLEEFQEATEELEDVGLGMKDFWKLVRKTKDNPAQGLVDRGLVSKVGDVQMDTLLTMMEIGILNTINELMQVAGILRKAKKFEGR
jgi:hypothetical protein